MLSVIALLAAAAAVSYYYYPVWLSNLQYATDDPQTRETLDSEKLQRGYRTAAKAFEQELRATLSKDPEIAAKIESYNSLILNGRKKYVDIGKGIVNSMNTFLDAHSKPLIALGSLMSADEAKTVLPDTKLIREIRVDVSDTPTSIRADKEDLLARYHADVNVTIFLVLVGGKVDPNQIGFIANATLDRHWTFPPVAKIKQRILSSLDELNRNLQSEMDLTLDKIQLSLQEKNLELQRSVSP